MAGEPVRLLQIKIGFPLGFSEMLKVSPEGSTSTLCCFGNWDPVLEATALHQTASDRM